MATIEEIAKRYGLGTDNFIRRADGRMEWICEHGIGHTVWSPREMDNIHGCDGCCRRLTP